MLTGFYTAASGMLTNQRALNVTANNMANVKTPGFRSERLVSTAFENALVRAEGNSSTGIGTGNSTRVVEEVSTLFDPSFMEETGRPFDLAINGEGFFNIQGTDQQFLTRNGNFDLDDDGYLVLRGVGRVLGEKGEIQLTTSSFTVMPDGTIYDGAGKQMDKLLLSQPQPPFKLNKFSNGLYVYPENTTQADMPAMDVTVLQNTLENSNIDLNREYSMVMELQRSFQSCSSALKTIDQVNQRTANEIARL